MKALIFEDEKLSAERLVQLIRKYDKKIEILDILPSIAAGVDWFDNNPFPDVVFMDVHLTDGPCFELFKMVKMNVPIIFITAYNEYAIQAFKVNSVDYLVKPLDYKALTFAIDKYKKLIETPVNQQKTIDSLLSSLTTENYKKRFLIKIGEQLKFIKSTDIAYFKYEDGIVLAVTPKTTVLPLDYSLDQLEKMLDPEHFFRVNRKFYLNINTIDKIHSYFNSRLKINIQAKEIEDIIVSREKVGKFKEWLDR